MAARKATAKEPEESEQPEATEAETTEAAATEADEVHERGGWDVGYRGDRVDPEDDDAYTVSGVLKAAQSGDAKSGDE
ncbi:hypothetical protein [Streptomyces sp.]|uniref:hypothetical protein n=1 Tax=Streptomyces sp. TaxID=1931 RepID=UPI002F92EB0A